VVRKKTKTLGDRLAFNDGDLKSPGHDAIMIWLQGELPRIFGERLGQTVGTLKAEWEHPVNSKDGEIVGFIDLLAQGTILRRGCKLCTEQKECKMHQLLTPQGTIVWAFEVKTRISSVGELVRQIRFYEHHTSNPYFNQMQLISVVSPDVRHRDILVGQEIDFIQSPDVEALTSPYCQRRLKADPLWRENAEVKLTHLCACLTGGREGDLPPRSFV
jgi:hypothetical protein